MNNNTTVVFFFECQGFIKIASSKYYTDFVSYITGQVKWGNPFDVKYLGYIPFDNEADAKEQKQLLKTRFKRLWHRNDWYHEDPELHKYIQKHVR
ncbi:MAG: hypothetical protein OXI43_21185 [Candidatus Poribacteria bacterium]|nr:hypothetical protein [Candidatus Poribacteria bacterium]